MTLADITKQIQSNATLGTGAGLLSTHSAITGTTRKLAPVKPMLAVAAGAAPVTDNSQLVTVGNQPAGFGSGFIWDRSHDEILLALFINPADYMGVYIDGIMAGDWVEVTSAAGLATFSTDKGHPLISGLVGLIAAGADAVATYYKHPEAIKVIDDAETFVQSQLKGTGAGTKTRDAFGVEPGTGLKARAEGGILVCLPDSGGPCYSGDTDHQSRWIKSPGDRTPANNPPQVSGAFFPMQAGPSNKMQATMAGQVYVLAWDWNFGDNAGYYKVFLHIKKGVITTPIIP
jgi:hypothetical protein